MTTARRHFSPLLNAVIAHAATSQKAPDFDAVYEMAQFRVQGGLHRMAEALGEAGLAFAQEPAPLDKGKLAQKITSELSQMTLRNREAGRSTSWPDFRDTIARVLGEELP